MKSYGTFRFYIYRERLHEGTELTHDLRKVPSLHQSCSELEGNAEDSEDHIRECQVGNVEVGHGLHSPKVVLRRIILESALESYRETATTYITIRFPTMATREIKT